MTIRIALPKDRMVSNAVIGFNIPHIAGVARYGDEILWSYGQDIAAQDKFVGNLFFRVPIRDEMWDDEIVLELEVTEDTAFSFIPDIHAMPAANSVRFFFSQFQMDLFLFLAFLVIFVMAFFVFAFYIGGGDLRWEGLFLSAFCVLLGTWFLSSHGFFYAFSDRIGVCAHIEYVAFYLMPVPFCLFVFVQVKKDRISRVLSMSLAVLFTILFVFFTVLNYATAHHYTAFLLLIQVLMLIGVIASVIMLVKSQHMEDLSRKITRYGIAISMFLLMLEVGRYNLAKYFFEDSVLGDLSLASSGMLAFAGALTVGYVARLTDAVGEESDKALLKRLAYIDILTGLSNRTYCDRIISEMEEADETVFALTFFDLNGLKWANDTYGHDMGDAFLCQVSAILQKIYGSQRFCGRWGGDEFIVCLTGDNIHYAETMLGEFNSEIDQLNRSGDFPFRISVAHGMVRSTEMPDLTISEAIKEADRRMYVTKSRMYEEGDAPDHDAVPRI